MIQARCAVCGTGLEKRIRACGRCESLYHPDCWQYNDGCAIYGCRRVAAQRPKAPRRLHAPARPAWHGPAFGALLGTAVICPWLLVVARSIRSDSMLSVACAAVLGAASGALLRDRHDACRIALCGLLGPGLTAWAIGLLFGAPIGWFLSLPLFPLFGMIASPLALPCALIAARFNDPELASPGRQALWLGVAFAAAIVSFALLLQRALVGA